MSVPVAALFYACLSIAAAYAAKPRHAAFAGLERVFIIWIGAAALGMLIPSDAPSLLAIAVLLVAAAPAQPVARVSVYLAVFMATPIDHNFIVPFPGLNYLTELSYVKLSVLILLGPCLLFAFRQKTRHLLVADLFVGAFFLMKSGMSARDLPFTSVLRETFDNLILIIIPYFVISRTLRTRQDMEKAMAAVFVGLLILAMIGVFSVLRQWNFYNLMSEAGHEFADFRGGFLRVSATLMSTLYGAAMALGALTALELGRRKMIGAARMSAYVLLFAVLIYFSGSRGAMLAAMAAAVTYFVYARMGSLMQMAYFAGGVLAALVLPGVILSMNFDSVDPYGTFAYRAELWRASVQEFANHPLFGNAAFRESPAFAHLRTGFGIIDFVNTYAIIALQYGLFGLFIFVGGAVAFVLACMRTATLLRSAPAHVDANALKGQNGLLLAGIVGLFVMIMTVSPISYVYYYIFAMFGLARALGEHVRALEYAAPPVTVTPPQAEQRERPVVARRDLPPHLRQYVAED